MTPSRKRSTSEHLYVQRSDPERAVTRYYRELHVCRALKPRGGVHLGVSLDLLKHEFGPNPPPGVQGHQRQIAAGLNLTRAQARKVIKQMQALLGDD